MSLKANYFYMEIFYHKYTSVVELAFRYTLAIDVFRLKIISVNL